MAWSFDGTNDDGVATIDLSGNPDITVCFWLKWDTNANTDEFAIEYTNNALASNGWWVIPNSKTPAAGLVQLLQKGDGGGYTNASIVRPSAAVWHHWAVRFKANTTYAANHIKAWIDGQSVTVSVITNDAGSGGNWASSSPLNLMSRAGTSLFGAGDMFDLAIYDGDIGARVAPALAFGGKASPLAVEASSLIHYWPLRGYSTTEADLLGGASMTIAGATAVEGLSTSIGPHWQTAAFVPRYATLAMPTGTITDGDMTARDCTITLHNAKWVA